MPVLQDTFMNLKRVVALVPYLGQTTGLPSQQDVVVSSDARSADEEEVVDVKGQGHSPPTSPTTTGGDTTSNDTGAHELDRAAASIDQDGHIPPSTPTPTRHEMTRIDAGAREPDTSIDDEGVATEAEEVGRPTLDADDGVMDPEPNDPEVLLERVANFNKRIPFELDPTLIRPLGVQCCVDGIRLVDICTMASEELQASLQPAVQAIDTYIAKSMSEIDKMEGKVKKSKVADNQGARKGQDVGLTRFFIGGTRYVHGALSALRGYEGVARLIPVDDQAATKSFNRVIDGHQGSELVPLALAQLGRMELRLGHDLDAQRTFKRGVDAGSAECSERLSRLRDNPQGSIQEQSQTVQNLRRAFMNATHDSAEAAYQYAKVLGDTNRISRDAFQHRPTRAERAEEKRVVEDQARYLGSVSLFKEERREAREVAERDAKRRRLDSRAYGNNPHTHDGEDS